MKFDWLVLSRYGIEVGPFDDTDAAFLMWLMPAAAKHGMDAPFSEPAWGILQFPSKRWRVPVKSMITFDKVPIDRATAYAAEDADVTLRLWQVLKTSVWLPKK